TARTVPERRRGGRHGTRQPRHRAHGARGAGAIFVGAQALQDAAGGGTGCVQELGAGPGTDGKTPGQPCGRPSIPRESRKTLQSVRPRLQKGHKPRPSMPQDIIYFGVIGQSGLPPLLQGTCCANGFSSFPQGEQYLTGSVREKRITPLSPRIPNPSPSSFHATWRTSKTHKTHARVRPRNR